MQKILIADDEAKIRRIIRDFLTAKGFETVEAEDGAQALHVFAENSDIALAVLDIMMPEMNGWEVCRKIRETSDVPVIFLTARGEEFDELECFECGADDFITKPFSPTVLVKRIEARLKRTADNPTDKIVIDGLVIDVVAHSVVCDGHEIELTHKEYGILHKLASNRERVFSREQLLDDIWGFDFLGDSRTVDSHVARLRTKLGDWGSRHLRTVYGARLTAIYDKSSQTLPFKAALGAVDGYLWGTSDHASHIVLENGERFCVNWEKGQKTGFFLDQRENRQLVKRYAKGRTVLNTFCYTGGFSVYALSGGAGEVCSVDSSERAVALATENMQLNFGDNAAHSEVAADAVDYLKDIGDKYDLIILDPPAFAKHHKVLGNAMQGYKRLNTRALSQIRPGGILFTFSCSQAVTKELFRTTVFSAAAIAGRKVRILHENGYNAIRSAHNPCSKALLAEWGLGENWKGVGNCILGYTDQAVLGDKARKEDRVLYV